MEIRESKRCETGAKAFRQFPPVSHLLEQQYVRTKPAETLKHLIEPLVSKALDTSDVPCQHAHEASFVDRDSIKERKDMQHASLGGF